MARGICGDADASVVLYTATACSLAHVLVAGLETRFFIGLSPRVSEGRSRPTWIWMSGIEGITFSTAFDTRICLIALRHLAWTTLTTMTLDTIPTNPALSSNPFQKLHMLSCTHYVSARLEVWWDLRSLSLACVG